MRSAGAKHHLILDRRAPLPEIHGNGQGDFRLLRFCDAEVLNHLENFRVVIVEVTKIGNVRQPAGSHELSSLGKFHEVGGTNRALSAERRPYLELVVWEFALPL